MTPPISLRASLQMSAPVVTIDSSRASYDAFNLMSIRGISAVAIVNESGHIIYVGCPPQFHLPAAVRTVSFAQSHNASRLPSMPHARFRSPWLRASPGCEGKNQRFQGKHLKQLSILAPFRDADVARRISQFPPRLTRR